MGHDPALVSCLAEDTVAAFVDGRLATTAEDTVLAHLDACAACRRLVASLVREEREDEGPRFNDGETVSQYRILGVIGAGAMGVVYAAFDPRLDRKVALKILRGRDGEEASSEALLREAKAMAQLSHPNVVAIHDVGTIGEHVFLAMDYVDGQSCAEWLRVEPRSRREVLDVFVQAGHGLAAAHAAGLVLRDFKPANLLVGFDARVRVADFGLARAAPPAVAPSGGSRTATSAAGTPAYMAPEQLRGESADARSDQYSFAVALEEALKGSGRIPRRLRSVLARARKERPEERYPTMNALLAALHRGPRTVWITGTATVVALAVAALALGARPTRSPPCPRADAKLAGVWDDAQKRAVRQAFAATGLPYAKDTTERAERVLDDYTRRWLDARTDACEATRVRGEQSEQLLDLRMACLAERLHHTRELTALFAKADPEVLEKATSALEALPRIEDCANTPRLRAAWAKRPTDPEAARRVAEIEAKLVEARALETAGKYDRALSVAEPALVGARALGFPPLEGMALRQVGRLDGFLARFQACESTLLEAAAVAESSGDVELTARAWIDLLRFVSYRKRPETCDHYSRYAEAAIRRVEGRDALEAERLLWVGAVRYMEGRDDEARTMFQRALDLTKPGPETDFVRLKARQGLALELQTGGNVAEAIVLQEQVLAQSLVVDGPAHPNTALTESNLGWMMMVRGRYENAIELFTRILTLPRENRPAPPALVNSLMGRALLYADLGRSTEALDDAQRGMRELEEASMATMEGYGFFWLAKAVAHRHQRHFREARAEADRGLRLLESVAGRSTVVAVAHREIASILFAAGNVKGAVTEARRAVAILDALPSPHPLSLAPTLERLGTILRATHDLAGSLDALERAVKIGESHAADPFDLANARFALAKTIAEARGDRARARSLATAAADVYRQSRYMAAKSKAVQQWLEAHPAPDL